MKNKTAASAATLSLCLIASLGSNASAQTSDTAQPTSDPVVDAIRLDDIIVTAQRRSERLQDVPVAVSALTTDFIQQHQIRTLQDLSAGVPGLVVTSSVNYGAAPLSIRGVGGAAGGGNVLADEPVAVYIDDAVVSRLRLSTADLIDIDGIEVLRGPQGTLYGRNSTAGAILIRSAEPTSEFTTKASGSVATYDEYQVQGAVSGPLNADATALGRIAGGYSNRGGWGDNTAGGPKLNRGESWQIRGFLRFNPTDALRLDLIADASHQMSYTGTIFVSDPSNIRDERTNLAGSNLVTPGVVRSDLNQILDDNKFSLNFPTKTRIQGQNVTARLIWDLGAAELTSISNYRHWNMAGTQDSDGLAYDPPTPTYVAGDTPNIGDNNGLLKDDQYSQELRLASRSGKRLTWLVGAYLYGEDNDIDFTIRSRLAGPGGSGTSAAIAASQKTRSYAVFSNIDYQITDELKLSLAGRYGVETKDIVDTLVVQTINAYDPPGPAAFTAGRTLVPLSTLTAKRKDRSFAPRVVLDWKITPATLVYVSYSKGYKSGGFNAFRGLNFAFDPEKIDAYEAGFKADLTDTLRLNGSTFRYNYGNLQVRTPIASGGVGIESVDKARINGAELEATLLPFEGLRFDANVAYLDAKFVAGTVSSIAQTSWIYGTNPPVTPENVAGNHMTRAPKLQGAVTGRYTFDFGENKASIMASVRNQSKVYFLETQQSQATYQAKAWAEVDARVSLASQDYRWEVALFAKNLLDNRHLTQVAAFFGLPNGSVNEPRKIGVQFAVKY